MRRAKVLLVDDSITFRRIVRLALEAEGYDVVCAADGVEGLVEYGRHDDLAALILDVHMPNLGGLEMMQRLKARGALRDVPFLVVSMEGTPAPVDEAKALGARGWLVKPCDGARIIQLVDEMLATKA